MNRVFRWPTKRVFWNVLYNIGNHKRYSGWSVFRVIIYFLTEMFTTKHTRFGLYIRKNKTKIIEQIKKDEAINYKVFKADFDKKREAANEELRAQGKI